MKSKNLKLLALMALLTVSGQSLLSNENEPETNQDSKIEMEVNSEECEIKVEIRSPKDRAMDLLRDFLDLAKHPQKKWHDWIDELNHELKELVEFTKFRETLTKLKGEKNPLKVGEALKEHKHLLADDLKSNIENMLINQKMKLFGILSTRIKK